MEMKVQIRNTILLCFLFISLNTSAQKFNEYKPVKYSSTARKYSYTEYVKKLKIKYISDDKGTRNDFNQMLYGLHLNYIANAKNKAFITEPYIVKYLQSIVDSIAAKNNLKEKYEVVCTRYLEANAYNMGDNKLYVNMGLLKILDNEAQLAFLLCHELSHQLLTHVQEDFIAKRKLRKDKTVQKEIKDINKAKYNKLDRTIQFVKDHSYDMAKYSRVQERAADSMAIVLLSNTNYDIREGMNLMRILDKSDKDSTVIDYDKYFAADGSKLPALWTKKKENLLEFGFKKAVELDEDSLKTHPDITNRIAMIDQQLKSAKFDPRGKTTAVRSASLFDSVKAVSKFEQIELYIKNKRYSAIVYHSLAMLDEFKDNTYLLKHSIMAMHKMNKAIKDHTISDHVPVESKDLSESYNSLLRIIDRTTLAEFKTILSNFVNRYYAKVSTISEVKNIYDEVNKK